MSRPVELFRFWVAGTPVPQGSKTARVQGRRAILYDDNAKVLGPWRQKISDAAGMAWTGEPIDKDTAVVVVVEFRFIKPKSVKREYPTVKPDVDKCARAVLDALTVSQIWRDDAQVVDLKPTKRYAAEAGALVRVGTYPTRKK